MNKIYVVGMGPGAYEQMTVKAVRAIEMSQVIVGYTVYTDLLKKEFPDKEYRNTPMRQEVERCRMAYEEAAAGKKGGHGMQWRCRHLWDGRPDV